MDKVPGTIGQTVAEVPSGLSLTALERLKNYIIIIIIIIIINLQNFLVLCFVCISVSLFLFSSRALFVIGLRALKFTR
jgi:hypothetical protein